MTSFNEDAEVKTTTKDTVACDGGGGALGHPKVFLHLDKQDKVNCPYCGCHFKRGGDGETDT